MVLAWVAHNRNEKGIAMRQFMAVHSHLIQGILTGYDRMLFRGTLRFLAFVEGMTGFMKRRGLLHKDFMAWSGSVTERIKADAIRLAERSGRPPIYLASSAMSKEREALAEAHRQGVSEGLIGVFSCVEPCLSYGLFRNRAQRTLDLQLLRRKCLHYYFYWLHPDLGLCHLRLQTWAPFNVQVCLNGRERLARQLAAARIAHQQRDNCFVWIANVVAAQQLADAQLDTRWEDLLDGLLDQAFPARRELFPEPQLRHYWSLQQSEWATDLLFHRTADLERLYPSLVRQAMCVFQSDDILRFLGGLNPGRVLTPGSRVEVTSDLKRRPEGLRVKHRVGDNSLKLYNKEGSVLRVETTINQIRDFKERRPGPNGQPVWRRLRKGVAATRRRAEVCQHANNRYLDALAATRTGERMEPLLKAVSRPVQKRGRRHRGLRPWGEDAALLAHLARGEFLLNGFRNRDVRAALSPKPTPTDPASQRKAAARVSRKLALLRAHGLVRKVGGTHRYLLTTKGVQLCTAVLHLNQVEIQDVVELAA
jgi:hypothetical protein